VKAGLLWFDDNPQVPLAIKVENAVRRYRERFGGSPDVCYVNPETLAGAAEVAARVQLVALATVQPNHFWVGVKSA
jgi:hypothetical protein